MRINDRELISGLRNYIEDLRAIERSQRDQQRVQGGRIEGRDRVEISRRSREAEKARKVVERTPDMDEKRVRELKDAIEQGRYNVKGEAVAENIIRRSIVDTLL